MIKPLALIYYHNLLPGSQLMNRLHDLGYKVQAVTEANSIENLVINEKPLVLVAEVPGEKSDICRVFGELRQNPATAHIPILAYVQNQDKKLQTFAHKAGANLVAFENGMLAQMPHLLEQILAVD